MEHAQHRVNPRFDKHSSYYSTGSAWKAINVYVSHQPTVHGYMLGAPVPVEA